MTMIWILLNKDSIKKKNKQYNERMNESHTKTQRQKEVIVDNCNRDEIINKAHNVSGTILHAINGGIYNPN